MRGLKLIGSVVSMALLLMLWTGTGTGGGMNLMSKPEPYRMHGAKFVAVTPQENPESKTFMEYVFDLAALMPGSEERAGTDLDALKARQRAAAGGMATFDSGDFSFEDMAGQARQSMELAQEMGIAVGPTAFDSYWDKQDAAMDPIRRLNGT